MMDESLRSPSGGIQVRATARGLPIALKLEPGELAKAPMDLAREILLLCQLAARRHQVSQRRELIARGFSPAVLRSLPLSTEEALAAVEAEVFGEDTDAPPNTWKKPV
jgi:hypothetical protein